MPPASASPDPKASACGMHSLKLNFLGGHLEANSDLHRRVEKAVHRNHKLVRLAAGFTLLNRHMLGDRHDLCWAVLDPHSGTMSLWTYPPEEDRAAGNVLHRDLEKYCVKGRNQSKDAIPPTVPFKSLSLDTLESVDSNPHFWTIFLTIKGQKGWTLTAPNQETFDKWMDTLDRYDVFSHPGGKCEGPPHAGDGHFGLKNLPQFKGLQDMSERDLSRICQNDDEGCESPSKRER